MTTKKRFLRSLEPGVLNQVAVLKSMLGKATFKPDGDIIPNPFRIHEIAEISGLNDEKEAQRVLFILEGQKLVTPLPEADLTSKVWQITTLGHLTVQKFDQSRAEEAA